MAAELRQSIREGAFLHRTTSGHAHGHAQANLCILPYKYAFDFLLFCQRNPKPCPLIEVLEPGVATLGPGGSIDVRTDVPGYRVFRDGVLTDEVKGLMDHWRDDLVTFVIGTLGIHIPCHYPAPSSSSCTLHTLT